MAAFLPIADDRGIDLLLYDKGSGRGIPLQVKLRTKTIRRFPNVAHFQVRAASFSAAGDAFVLAALLKGLDTRLVSTLERLWLIPMTELTRVARATKDNYVLRPSASERSRDKYTKYRCLNLAEVANRLANCP